MSSTSRSDANKWLVGAALVTLYLLWGSTYLGIKYAVETLPPLLMGGARYTLAGLALFTLLRVRGAPGPTRTEWRQAVVSGAFLLVGGNGLVTWGQKQQV